MRLHDPHTQAHTQATAEWSQLERQRHFGLSTTRISGQVRTTHTLIDTKPHTHTCPCGGWHQPETTAYTILTHFNKIFVYMVIVPFFCLWVAWWVGFRHRRIMFKWLFSSLFFFFFLEDFVKCLLLKVQTKYLLSVTLNQTFFFPNLSSIKKYFCFFNKKQTYWYCFFPLCINTQVCSFM